AAHHADDRLTDKETERYAEITAGLKSIQILTILTPPPVSAEETRERQQFIISLLTGPDAAERAGKLAKLTAGMSREEIAKLIGGDPHPASGHPFPQAGEGERKEVDLLIAKRKREILERECFGLIEFVEAEHGFEV